MRGMEGGSGGFGFPFGGDPEDLLRGLQEFAEQQAESVQEAQREQFATLTLNTAVELTSAALSQIDGGGERRRAGDGDARSDARALPRGCGAGQCGPSGLHARPGVAPARAQPPVVTARPAWTLPARGTTPVPGTVVRTPVPGTVVRPAGRAKHLFWPMAPCHVDVHGLAANPGCQAPAVDCGGRPRGWLCGPDSGVSRQQTAVGCRGRGRRARTGRGCATRGARSRRRRPASDRAPSPHPLEQRNATAPAMSSGATRRPTGFAAAGGEHLLTVREVIEGARLDDAARHGVDPDAARRELDRQVADERFERRLRGLRSGSSSRAALRPERRDRDDRRARAASAAPSPAPAEAGPARSRSSSSPSACPRCRAPRERRRWPRCGRARREARARPLRRGRVTR